MIHSPVRIAFALWGIMLVSTAAQAAPMVDFGRDVYPILRRACFECHGARLQEGDLRLDSRDAAFESTEVIVKGNAAESELYRRIMLPASDADVMPKRGKPLSKPDIERIKVWIEQGAEWPDDFKSAPHWAYVAPQRSVVPDGRDHKLNSHSPIDAFVHSRLQAEGLVSAPEAPREILLRRVSLDLIGLPPSPAEVDAFLNDPDPNAYEQVVDRLLASDQFGVRWARPWLDAARYADSHGFQRDDFRDLWPYRDWVVTALNDDLPFTQFTIEQLAGDLLPEVTTSQRIATGFNRSSPTNVEAGSDPEETRVNQVHDRVNTLGMVWLGSTFECCQCHDHKYDPFTTRDYYGLFAFFNSTEIEAERTNPNVPGSIQFKGPSLELMDSATRDARQKLQTELAEVKRELAALENSASVDQAEWEAALRSRIAEAPVEHVLDITAFESTGGATHEILPDKSVLLSGEPAPDKDTYLVEVKTKLTGVHGIKLEALTDDSLPGRGPGRGDEKRPNFVLNNFQVTVAAEDQPEQPQPVKFTSARASFSQANLSVENLLKNNNTARSGWAINPKFHEPHWAVLETAEPLGFASGSLLRFRLEQNFGAGRTIGRLRLSAVTGSVGGPAVTAELTAALNVPAEKRSAKQKQVITAYRLQDNPMYARLRNEQTKFEQQLKSISPPTTLVMRELPQPRTTTVFERGDFRNPGEILTPGVPSALHPLGSESSKPTRLELARWLVSRDNPLVARVTVNRWWSELFGHGLVTTPEDFGIKGEPPTHPELLDWLACEFMDNGWSMKKLLKTIVMSATYRQSSRVTPDLLARDDQNLWYARGPRFRMDAETIRDNALAISGLLSLKAGGPPIRPFQPDGLWVKVGGQRYDYEVSPGEDRYRRGLYVVWKRSAPYPSFVNFDANSRLACRVKRPRSNTPLQALTLMNDSVYVEAAMAFAKHVLLEKPTASTDERLIYAFRRATGRTPRAEELVTLSKLLSAVLSTRTADPKSAEAFVGQFDLPPNVNAPEFTAWYAVAAALLNLDETISKG